MKPILVVWETHHLGDALLSLPFIRVARKHREVRVVCRRNQAPLYRAYDPELKVWEWEPFWAEDLGWGGRMASVWGLLGLLWKLRGEGLHEAVSCWADVRVHLLMLLGGAGKRVGLPMVEENFYAVHLPWRRKKLEKGAKVARFFEKIFGENLLSDPVFRKPAAPAHWEVWRSLGAVWGWNLELETPWLEVGRLKEGPLLEFLREAKREGRQIWMVHPGARHPARRWPLEFFRETVSRKLDEKLHAVIFVETATEHWPEPASWQRVFKPESLEELMACTNQVDVVLCNDSFPAHLGAALGKIVWTIFSNQDPALFAPFQNEARVIAKNVCEVRPCLDRCVKPSFQCLEAVRVEDVVGRIEGG